MELNLYSLRTSSRYEKEQVQVDFYDGGGSLNVLGNTLIHGTYFRNLIIDCMCGEFEEVKILGEELKQM